MLLHFWPAHLPITPITYTDRGMKGGGVMVDLNLSLFEIIVIIHMMISDYISWRQLLLLEKSQKEKPDPDKG